jgi:glycyl-tRNA synthetase
MADAAALNSMDLDGLRAATARQGNLVRQMKKDGTAQVEVTAAVVVLKEMKALLEAKVAEEEEGNPQFNRSAMDDLLIRRMYVVKAFEIYGGVAGFFDFGPPGCALKANVLAAWKRHFILHDNMLEVECTNLMPSAVLETSGHVERFTDNMVKDVKTGECYRADKLLEDHIEDLLAKNPTFDEATRTTHEHVFRQADAYTPEELGAQLTAYGIKATGTGNDLSAPFPFNLMFKTTIGPEGTHVGFLRPETAQGIFLNFKRLLDYNAGKMPFASAQIGLGFRNEISPRAGLLRVREFTMAEIEHFVNPADKSHPAFPSVAGHVLTLFPSDAQMGDGKLARLSAGEAVAKGVIANETLAYFLVRTALFAAKIGIDMERVRFRQHLPTEMAHYASDCWDLEVKLSYGWTECAGHADRSCYDLEVHAKKTKVEMKASHKYDVPKMVDMAVPKMNKGLMGKTFGKTMKFATEMLDELTLEAAMALEDALAAAEGATATLGPDCHGNTFELTRAMVSWKKVTKKVSEVKYVPGVIEPSFGIGRLVYSVFEHNFYLRDGSETAGVMAFPVAVAPIKVALLPLSGNAEFAPFVRQLEVELMEAGISSKSDSSGTSIGRRYARMDELGVPFDITIDFETVGQARRPCTMRERDSTHQVVLPLADVTDTVRRRVVLSTARCRLLPPPRCCANLPRLPRLPRLSRRFPVDPISLCDENSSLNLSVWIKPLL